MAQKSGKQQQQQQLYLFMAEYSVTVHCNLLYMPRSVFTGERSRRQILADVTDTRSILACCLKPEAVEGFVRAEPTFKALRLCEDLTELKLEAVNPEPVEGSCPQDGRDVWWISNSKDRQPLAEQGERSLTFLSGFKAPRFHVEFISSSEP